MSEKSLFLLNPIERASSLLLAGRLCIGEMPSRIKTCDESVLFDKKELTGFVSQICRRYLRIDPNVLSAPLCVDCWSCTLTGHRSQHGIMYYAENDELSLSDRLIACY
jgi:hypothetical protein